MDYEKIISLVKQTKDILFNRDLAQTTTQKGAFDYVTQVDYSVQAFLQAELAALHPEITMFSEEQKKHDFDRSRSYWILDPVDGTTNLIHGYGVSAVSLALYQEGDCRFGVIYDPFREELFLAEQGKGAFCNGKPIHVSSYTDVEQALIGFGTSPYQKQYACRHFALIEDIFMDCQDLRRSGSAALDLAYVAAGRTDAFFEYLLQPWDYAAGMVILREAGGSVSTWCGEALPIGQQSDVLVTNGCLHKYMLQKMAKYFPKSTEMCP